MNTPIADEPLESIGFATLTDARCRAASPTSPLGRCVLVLTDRCNFACPYCRKLGGGDLPFDQAAELLRAWAADGLKAVVFTGGEPTLHPRLPDLVSLAARLGIPRIGLGTNGAADPELYRDLVDRGVNDVSFSLDSAEAAEGDAMAGGIPGSWARVVATIRAVAARCYTTVGIVVTAETLPHLTRTVLFASSLGVSDLRINPAAQFGAQVPSVDVPQGFRERHPIWAWRDRNFRRGTAVRGLAEGETRRCHLPLDEMTVKDWWHYPCFVYLREGGRPIGPWGPQTREDRARWSRSHDAGADPICLTQCPDICRAYNRRRESLTGGSVVG